MKRNKKNKMKKRKKNMKKREKKRKRGRTKRRGKEKRERNKKKKTKKKRIKKKIGRRRRGGETDLFFHNLSGRRTNATSRHEEQRRLEDWEKHTTPTRVLDTL